VTSGLFSLSTTISARDVKIQVTYNQKHNLSQREKYMCRPLRIQNKLDVVAYTCNP
jgi:hypothetical protein